MGKIELDHTGSGGGVTLSSDGTDLLLDGTAIGGGGGGGAFTVVSKPDAYTVGSSDLGKILVFTGSWNEYATLGSASTLGSGFYVTITNQSGSTHIINCSGSDIISPNGGSGDTAYRLASGASVTLISDGTSKWLIQNISPYLYVECNNNSGNFNPTATGTGAVALGRGANAGGSASFAAGASSGFSGSTANGAGSTALGGSYASGANSFAAAIATNSSSYGATGANSIAMGNQAKATDSRAVVIGGSTNTAAGPDSVAIGGQQNTAGTFANGYAIASGYDSHAYGAYSIALGNRGRALEDHKYAHGVFPEGSQYGRLILKAATTDATATALASSGSASSDNQVILPNNSAFAFHGTIVARQQASAGTACAAWKIEGLIRREGSAGTTVLVNSATTVLDNTPAWGMALSADTTNGGLAITATGAAATNIRWVATIHTSEVTYA